MDQNTTRTYEDCARSTVIRDRTRYLRWSGVVQRVRPAVPLGSAPVILRWLGLAHAVRRVLVDAMCVLLTTPVVLKSPSS